MKTRSNRNPLNIRSKTRVINPKNFIKTSQKLTKINSERSNQKKSPAPLQSLENIIFELTEDNFELSTQTVMKFFSDIFPYSFNILISRLIYSAFISQRKEVNLYLNFLKFIELKEENIQCYKIIYVFERYLIKLKTQESNYLLNKMIEHEFIQPDFIGEKKSFYFAHYYPKEEILQLKHLDSQQLQLDFINNYEELSKNDWELHKKYIKEGHNPNEIAKIIRNDEIEKLQEISSQTNFNFNQTIEPSLYERCSIINKENVTLIDYAAFFSSVKCFKYLLMNGAKVENTGKYAVAGENVEIIHLCEQNHSSFEDAYETAIEFHRNDIFKYLYENKITEINDLNKFGILSLKHNNFKTFIYLKSVGLKISNDILGKAIKIGNLFFLNRYIKNKQYFSIIYSYPCSTRNYEIIKLVLEQNNSDKSSNNIYLINFIFVFISLCFIKFFFNLFKLFNTQLLDAAKKEYVETVQWLVKQQGINVNHFDI